MGSIRAFPLIIRSFVLCSSFAAPAGSTASSQTVHAEIVDQDTATFIAVGDNRLDGPVGDIIRRHGFEAPLEGIRRELHADIIFGNLECPVTDTSEKVSKKWNFKAPPANLRTLNIAGFTVLNLANNHVMDFGATGLEDTLSALKRANLPFVGAGKNREEALKPFFKVVHGIKVGILGFTSTFPDSAWAGRNHPGVAYSNFDRFPEIIRKTKAMCDVLIVSFHGGTELAMEPNDVQKAFGRVAIDAGADLVVAHHPHVVQPVEEYKGKFILYSIGNFLFVSPTPTTRFTVLTKVTLTKNGVKRIDFIPLDTNYGRPVIAPPEGAKTVFDALNAYGAITSSSGTLNVKM